MIAGCECPSRHEGIHDATCTEIPDGKIIPFVLGCDETYFDVHCLVPVHLRFLADDEQSARDQFTDVEMTVTGPHVAHSTGFPQEMIVKAVE